jgi:hypothetical protein
MSPINILENHSAACFENRSCDFNCFKLTRVHNVKYLGIHFDEDMKWKTQINLNIKRLRKLFYIFKELNIILDLFTLRGVYFALVQSVLSYGIVLWGSAYPTTMEQLNTTHRILIRIALKGYDRTNTTQLFDILGIFNIKQLIEYFSLIQLHSDLSNRVNECLSIIPKGRRENCLRIPKCNTTAYQNYYQYKAIAMFNKLPNHIKLINDKILFKKKCKKYMLERNTH